MNGNGTLPRRAAIGALALVGGTLVVRHAHGDKPGSPQEWSQWRGPNRDGFVSGDDWPDKLELTQSWRKPLGPSYSGPIVGGDRVFSTETRDRKDEVVHAFDRSTGESRWSTDWKGAMSVPFFAKSNGDWIRSTPAFDGQTLYVGGMNDVLVAIDAATGERRWTIDFAARFSTPKPSFGLVCSPLPHGENLYIQAGAALAKVRRSDGEVLWRAVKDEGGMYGSAFSSPVVANLAGVEQCVVQTRTKLAGVELETGAELWSLKIEAFRGMNILTPTILGDTVFTSAYGGKAQLFRVAKDGDAFKAEEVWSVKQQGYMSSPIVVDGHIYLHLRNQRFACLDAATGAEKWTTKPYGKYWSIAAQGRKLLALDESGVLRLIAASPEKFQLLDEKKIAEPDRAWGHVAISGREVFVRELDALAAYRWG